MLMFTLAITYLTTSNLPWFMDLTFQVPINIALYSIRPCFYHQSYPTAPSCFCFGSIPSFFSGVISPLISSSILGTYWPGKFIFQCPIFLPFHTVHGVFKARILKWFAIPFFRGPQFFRTLHHDMHMAYSFIELDKAVFHVIRLVSFLWLWFSVCLPSDAEG